ncbi:putative house-cleaning noncanonical NTP pyrophosphatase (MazG superfamily) [Tumebacillus sp. BK434]|uniref:nucleoside triphosphate pyrophosphohydrolase n=1 Tax=Tumebacillus sp. BK434 TaxID=2512169 RepID=UPI001050DA0D|nr:nucleoside triphosphate pyrophosphohydrolase [Tumebacillus sp. BK434]TCP58192.1 putative house-cleaning noncanonical NTP pyrophosphatase (MazG superfamily) [Tumebacillus sp. BK434]
MPTYNKLVRDRIIEIIETSGRTPKHHVLDDEGYKSQLRIKLQEELQEYLTAEESTDSVEELADLLEIIFALGKVHGASESDLLAVRAKKAEERGGFEKRLFLERVEE